MISAHCPSLLRYGWQTDWMRLTIPNQIYKQRPSIILSAQKYNKYNNNYLAISKEIGGYCRMPYNRYNLWFQYQNELNLTRDSQSQEECEDQMQSHARKSFAQYQCLQKKLNALSKKVLQQVEANPQSYFLEGDKDRFELRHKIYELITQSTGEQTHSNVQRQKDQDLQYLTEQLSDGAFKIFQLVQKQGFKLQELNKKQQLDVFYLLSVMTTKIYDIVKKTIIEEKEKKLEKKVALRKMQRKNLQVLRQSEIQLIYKRTQMQEKVDQTFKIVQLLENKLAKCQDSQDQVSLLNKLLDRFQRQKNQVNEIVLRILEVRQEIQALEKPQITSYQDVTLMLEILQLKRQ